MQVEIKMDDSYTEPKIILLTATMTKEVNMILNKLSENPPQVISGCRNGKIEVIEQEDLIRSTRTQEKYSLLQIKANIRYVSGCMKSKNAWIQINLSAYQIRKLSI